MLVYHLSPSFEYQDDPWIKWRQTKQSDSKVQGKNRFQKIARSVFWRLREEVCVVIIYTYVKYNMYVCDKRLVLNHMLVCEW